jgi:5-methyltetrahydropteroyltriglutamate--homocysteine methyltransferase
VTAESRPRACIKFQGIDHAELGKRIHAAVAEVVAKQRKAGIDIINDGEVSKPTYTTYVKDRLSGFGGTGNTFVYQDLVEFPNLAKRVFGDPRRSRRKTPACNGTITVSDSAAVRIDVENLRSALGTKKRHANVRRSYRACEHLRSTRSVCND